MRQPASLPGLAESATAHRPLADRMRPRRLEEIRGQDHLLAPGKALHRLLTDGVAHSMVLWGPPGSGKTTLARLAAQACQAEFIALSAVMAGVQDIPAGGRRARPGAVPRRGAPFQQGPAGPLPAVRRGRHADPDRRDDGESVVRTQFRIAVARAR